MTKRVLDVGQCDPDHGQIVRYLSQHFTVEIDRAKLADEALARLRNQPYDLVLVNRLFDEDGYEGSAFIQRLKADPQLASLPVMLVTNYADHQQAAVALGAAPGFGKSQYDDPQTREKLARFLEPTASA